MKNEYNKMDNFCPEWNKNITKFNHHPNIPNSFRMLIVGPSNCGKTHLLLKMLLIPNFLDYNNLIIFSKTVNQPEYQLILHGFQNKLSKYSIISIFQNQNEFDDDLSIPEICEKYAEEYPENNDISVSFHHKTNEIPYPNELNKNQKNLIVFDDCITMKNQEMMEAYYTRGRHNNCNCIYLSQSYFDLPKNTIRGNSNLFIFFELPKRDLDIIYQDFSHIIDKEEFYTKANMKEYEYLVINKKTKNFYDSVF